MNLEEIKEVIHTPNVLREILGTYSGAFSVGLGRSRQHEGHYVILLRVEDEEPEGFPKEVTIKGHLLPVVVRGDFEAPRPVNARKTVGRAHQRRKDAA